MNGHQSTADSDQVHSPQRIEEEASVQENSCSSQEKNKPGGPFTSTVSLIGQAEEGSELAFARIFEKFHRRLALFLHYHLSQEMRGKLEVDDLLQEVFFRAFRDLNRFQYQSPGSFLRWLFQIASHVIQDGIRYHERQKRREKELVPFRSESNPFGADPAHSWTPSRILNSDEEVKRLMSRLDSLSEDYRQIILLTKIEGLTTAEAAARLGKTREAAALLLHRALQRFLILLNQ